MTKRNSVLHERKGSLELLVENANFLTSQLINNFSDYTNFEGNNWIDFFNLYYGDLLEGNVWKKRITSLGFNSKNEKQTLFCMYTSYALTIRGITNSIISHKFPSENTDKIKSIFDNKFYNYHNIKLNVEIDMFDWPLNSNNPQIDHALNQLEFNISTFDLDRLLQSVDSNYPFTKLIFQQLFPKEIRHHLGEYYTPKWLVQLTLEQILKKKDKIGDRRFLDASCGSGAFLVELIRIMSDIHDIQPEKITDSVVGIDINPIAVIASQCNYILSLSLFFPKILKNKDQILIKIPVYLGDSMLAPKKLSNNQFSLPTNNTDIIYNFNNSQNSIHLDGSTDQLNKSYIHYQHTISEIGSFTDLIGNPPWISWEHISPNYKKKMKTTFLDEYLLFENKGIESRLGLGHDDICVAFLIICADRFLTNDGKISLLLKHSIYQGEAHETFRKLSIKKAGKEHLLKLENVVDLSSGNPFESPGALASIASLSIGSKTKFPVPFRKYHMNSLNGNHVDIELKAFLDNCTYEDLKLMPSDANNTSLPWMIVKEGENVHQSGENQYPIRHGYVNDLTSLFFVEIESRKTNSILIKPSNSGHKKVNEITYEIEANKVYPCLKAKHIKKWKITGHNYIIVPQKKYTENNEDALKKENPLLYSYLLAHKNLLLERKSIHIRKEPFYSTFGVGDYTFSLYKVFFNAMGSLSQSFVVGSEASSKFLDKKLLIPHNNINCISLNSEDEAYYVCGVLNSKWVADYVKSRIGKSKYPWSNKMMERIPVPLFDNNNKVMQKICKLSKKIHFLARENKKYNMEEASLNSNVHKLLTSS